MKVRYILALAVGAVSCTPESDLVQMTHQGPAQGSTFTISYLAKEGVDFGDDIDSTLKYIDSEMSLWVDSSSINRLNNGDTLILSAEMKVMLTASRAAWRLTKGHYDITAAPIIKAWGFSRGIRRDSVPIDSIMAFVGFDKMPKIQDTMALPAGMQIDLNGIAQGYTVDVITAFLERRGIQSYMVEIGGEVRCNGTNVNGRKWRIGIDQPQEERTEGQFQTIVELDSMSLATSGNYRKYWVNDQGQRVVHTINPKTGMPAESNLLSASIISSSATMADAFGTACMVMGAERGKRFIEGLDGVEGYFIIGTQLGGTEVLTTSGWSQYELD